MKRIPLTQGKYAIVDDEDYKWLNQWKWRCHKHGRGFCAIRTSSLSETPKGRTTILMHRAIMNAQIGQEIDHRNHNNLDNRRNNLRFCTHSQNLANAQSYLGKNMTSQYKGVRLSKQSKKWRARIMKKGKCFYLGYFDNEIEAAKAYDKKAKELYGEFACINF